MEAKAYLRHVRIAPRKVQIVLNLIRGKDVKVAQAILEQTPKSASEYLLKLRLPRPDHETHDSPVQRQREQNSQEDFAHYPFLERKGIS